MKDIFWSWMLAEWQLDLYISLRLSTVLSTATKGNYRVATRRKELQWFEGTFVYVLPAPRYNAYAVTINNKAASDFNAQSFSALTFLGDRPTLKCAALWLAAALESTHRSTYAIIQHSSTKKGKKWKRPFRSNWLSKSSYLKKIILGSECIKAIRLRV